MPSQAALARLREIRRKVGERITVDMDVPGYQGMLVARFGPLPWDVVEKGIGKVPPVRRVFPLPFSTTSHGNGPNRATNMP